MSLLTVAVVIVVVGLLVAFVYWLPIPPFFKKIFYVVAVLFLVIWLANAFGLIHFLDTVRVPGVGSGPSRR